MDIWYTLIIRNLIKKRSADSIKLLKVSKNMKTIKSLKNNNLLKKLVDLQIEAQALPKLSHVEKAKFEQQLAIDQLYYSSKLEGSTLTNEMIDKAIHGKKFSAT